MAEPSFQLGVFNYAEGSNGLSSIVEGEATRPLNLRNPDTTVAPANALSRLPLTLAS